MPRKKKLGARGRFLTDYLTSDLPDREIARALRVSPSTVARWRAEYGGEAAAVELADRVTRMAQPPSPRPARRRPLPTASTLPIDGELPTGVPPGSEKVLGGLYETPDGRIIVPPGVRSAGP